MMEDHNAPLPLSPGTKVRAFQIEKKLGEGSFGIVYAATHEILGDPIEAAGSADLGTSPQEAGGANRRALPEPAQAGGIWDGVESEPTPAPETEHLSELTPAARTATLALIEALTAGFGCGRIEASLSPNRVVKLSGHLGSVEDSIALRIRLRALEHVDSVQDDGVQIFGWPFCQVIATLRDVLAHADESVQEASILLNKTRPLYREGEYLVVTAMNNNPGEAHLPLDYVNTAGDVVHMLPTATDRDNRVEGWGQFAVGSEDEATCRKRQYYQISAPHGRSLLVAVRSSGPLLPGPRHQAVEQAADYFSILAGAIRSARARGSNEIALGYQFLETRQ